MRQQLKHVIGVLSEGITKFNGMDQFPPKSLEKMLKALNQMPGEAQSYVKSGRDPRFNYEDISRLPSSLKSSIAKAAAFSINHRWIGIIKGKDEYITPKSLHHELAHLKFPGLSDGTVKKILEIVAQDGAKIVQKAFQKKPVKESPETMKKVVDAIEGLGYKRTVKKYGYVAWKFNTDPDQLHFDNERIRIEIAIMKMGYRRRSSGTTWTSFIVANDDKMPEVALHRDEGKKRWKVYLTVRKKEEKGDMEIDELERNIEYAKKSMRSIKKSKDPYFGLELDLMIPPSQYKNVASSAGVKHLDDQYVTLAVHLHFARLGNYLQKIGEFAREEAVTYLVTTDKKVSKLVFS